VVRGRECSQSDLNRPGLYGAIMLKGDNLDVAIDIAAIPERIKGFGYVKIANVALAREREMALLHRLNPMRYLKPAMGGTVSADGGVKVHWVAKSREEVCVRE
jgi:hypothetical protein